MYTFSLEAALARTFILSSNLLDKATADFPVENGTVDWVAVSETTFSASIAILGRLSKAGLEPLTIAVAQAMATGIPIGVHGEKRLRETMSSLKSFNIFGDVVFFGIGASGTSFTLWSRLHKEPPVSP